jgi:GDPmannose 4,6-dehydratase
MRPATSGAPTALVTGAAGQDGIYLARRLLAEGRRVVGTVSPGGSGSPRVVTYLAGVEVVEHDLSDADATRALVLARRPDEVYNLAAQSSVAQSWKDPVGTDAVNAGAVRGLLAAAAELTGGGTPVRVFQASSAEVGGDARDSPYARSKARAELAVREAREAGVHAVYARLHGHESPIRPQRFVTRKITRGAAEIALGRRDTLTLGNLDVHRDWGFAGEYVDAFVRLLRHDEPVDVPLGTGRSHSLAELVETAFAAAGVADPWSRIEQDPALLRPADSTLLLADPEPAAALVGWRATTSFEDLVDRMVQVDLRRLATGVEDAVDHL